MKKLFTVFVAFAALGWAAACTVSFPDDGAPNTFKCESNSECIEGQVCEKNDKGVKVCQEPGGQGECVDEDEDGYGSDLGPRNNCPACNEGRRNGCKVDCADKDVDKHPGKFENCDNKDNDCDGDTDEPAGTGDMACGADLPSCPLMTMPPQTNTQFGCKEVGGTPQCVVLGDFSGTEECMNAGGKTFGTCENGSWTEVPCECRKDASKCSN